MTGSDEMIEKLRDAVERVKGTALDDPDVNAPLELDSINRISLITELENDFLIELDADDIDPDIFDSLSSLAALMDKIQK